MTIPSGGTPSVEVLVNGELHPTYLDKHGVQRFVPNDGVRFMVDQMFDVFEYENAIGKRIPLRHGSHLGLNGLAVARARGTISLEDYMAFHILMGYSVSGFCEIMEGVVGDDYASAELAREDLERPDEDDYPRGRQDEAYRQAEEAYEERYAEAMAKHFTIVNPLWDEEA